MNDKRDEKSSSIPEGLPGCPRCAWLEKRLILLEEKVAALEARLSQNSRNSHKPPSSDGYTKPNPQSLRPQTDRKPGGQNGHPGSTLLAVPNPDKTVVHPLDLCPCGCGRSLKDLPVLRYDKRQVFDLPELKLLATEHQVEVKICPWSGREVSAAFPAGVDAPVQYGPRFNAYMAYMRGQQLLPLDRLCQSVADLFNRSISEATVQSAMVQGHHALAGFEARTAELLIQAPLGHSDETGLRVAGKLHWLHVLSNRFLTWYGVHQRRGIDAIKDFNLLPRFTGRLIHDCLSGYFQLGCPHGLCNAHLLRELTFLYDVLHQKWAGRMLDLMIRMHRSVVSQKERDGPPVAVQWAAWTRKYRAVLRQGFSENPLPDPPREKRRGRPKHTKAQNLLLRLREHEASVLAFLLDSRVPFTNNQAERDLRMMKVQQKISGTFRSIEGAQIFARVRAYLSTVRKNNRNVFQELVAAFSGNPFIPQV